MFTIIANLRTRGSKSGYQSSNQQKETVIHELAWRPMEVIAGGWCGHKQLLYGQGEAQKHVEKKSSKGHYIHKTASPSGNS